MVLNRYAAHQERKAKLFCDGSHLLDGEHRCEDCTRFE